MTISAERMVAAVEDDFVVFLIGMRINHFHRPWQWLPVARAMGRMLPELMREPDLGLRHARSQFGLRNVSVIQYRRSFDHLHAYAHAPAREHRPASAAFNRAIGSGSDVGIWLETYLVAAGQDETVYNNMLPYGLGRAGKLVPHAAVARRRSADWVGTKPASPRDRAAPGPASRRRQAIDRRSAPWP